MHGQGRYVGEEGVVEGLWVAGELSSLRDPDLAANEEDSNDGAEKGWTHQSERRKARKIDKLKKKQKHKSKKKHEKKKNNKK